jgi:hypothetical protein
LDLHAEDASAWGPFCGELDDIAIDPYLEFEGSFLRTTTTYPVVVLLVKARGRNSKHGTIPDRQYGKFHHQQWTPHELQDPV